MQEEQERIYQQLVQTLQERAGLDPAKAAQVADIVGEFAQQNLSDILRAFVPGGAGAMLGGLGRLFGGRG
ncbi:MAG: hypothetical protein M3Q65_18730 [Chloroflexota bacterium]|nr:hypothetical protein [Chloroflexota bacterium]